MASRELDVTEEGFYTARFEVREGRLWARYAQKMVEVGEVVRPQVEQREERRVEGFGELTEEELKSDAFGLKDMINVLFNRGKVGTGKDKEEVKVGELEACTKENSIGEGDLKVKKKPKERRLSLFMTVHKSIFENENIKRK